MDSLYEYGSRAGFWRIHNEFSQRGLPLTVFGVAMALARHPEVVEAIKSANYDVVSHGWRWIHYQNLPEDVEREHMRRGIEIIERLTPASVPSCSRESPRSRRRRRCAAP